MAVLSFLLSFLLFSSSIIILVNGQGVHLSAYSNPILERDVFKLNCSYSTSQSSQLIIDGSFNSDKFNRLQTTLIEPGLTIYVFINITLADQGTLFQCVTSSGAQSNYISLSIYFPPTYSPPILSPLYNGTSGCISLNMTSFPYPTNSSWSHNGSPVTNTTAHSVCFNPLTPLSNGSYTVTSSNIAGNGSLTVDINVYYGPSFKEGANITKWIEHSTGSNFTLPCTVLSPNPLSLPYTLYSSNSSFYFDNIEFVNNDDTYGEYVFTGGVVSNHGNYTCILQDDDSVTTLDYWVFIGGPPEATITANVYVSYSDVLMNIQLTDTGSAPVIGLLIDINNGGYNHTLLLDAPVINTTRTFNHSVSLNELIDYETTTVNYTIGVYNNISTINNLYTSYFIVPSHSMSSSFSLSSSSEFIMSSSLFSSLFSSTHYLTTTVIVSPSFTPPFPPAKSNGTAIAVGILVPLLLLMGVACIAMVIVFILKWRNTRTKTMISSTGTYEQIGGVTGNSYESFLASDEESD